MVVRAPSVPGAIPQAPVGAMHRAKVEISKSDFEISTFRRAGSRFAGESAGAYAAAMKKLLLPIAALALTGACAAPTTSTATTPSEGFDRGDASGWRAASTGGQGPDASWQVRADSGAVSAPRVVSLTSTNHSSEDRFNLFWSDRVKFTDGKLSISVRADEGAVDQGGGLAWRIQDANNYYICRINPLESNYRVYVVKAGVRRQLATARAAIDAKRWYRLEVEHRGQQIVCSLDGRALLEATDATIPAGGGVGLWTKADARTSFDDLALPSPPK